MVHGSWSINMNSSFNPKARWDRYIPDKDTNHAEPGSLDEKISVLALFKDARIYPRSFVWKNKPYEIKEITYSWQEKNGRETINYFSVSTGSDLYQISFNNTSYSWRMDRIIS